MADDTIIIEYGAIKNERANSGWLPVIWVNGRQRGNTYWPTGYSQADAISLAKRDAEEEGARYVGDWHVTVTERAVSQGAAA